MREDHIGKDPDKQSDEELVMAANRGEAEAMEALYFRYRDWAYSLAWRFCGNREDALDVLQDTFAYFFNKLKGISSLPRLIDKRNRPDGQL